MRAARWHARGDVRIEEVPEPELVPGSVAVDVAWCGICGTDLHEYTEGPIFIPAPGHPHPVSGESAPLVIGHEFSGVVSALGEGVDDLRVGEPVVVEPYILRPGTPTGDDDSYQLSPDMNFIGLGGRGGGLAERIVVERRWVHPVGDVPLDQAALVEPLAVGHHAYRRSGARSGDVALVGGAGPIGLLLAALLEAEGLRVLLTEVSEARKAKARDTGVAEEVLDPRDGSVADRVRELTGGRGADVCFECSSVQPVLDTLLDAVRPGGVVVNVSIWGHRAELDIQSLVLKEVDLRGTIGYAGDHPATIRLVQEGKVDLAPFITHRIGLDELVEVGYDTLLHRTETAVKILVSPTR